MSAEKDAPVDLLPHGANGLPQSLAVLLRAPAWWWAMRMELSKREIAAEHVQTRVAERMGQSDQQWRLAV